MIRLSDTATLFHADCRDVLRTLPSDSLDSCCTDPPYALVSTLKRFANSPRSEAAMPTSGPHARASRGFMGKSWDTGETAFSVEFWAEVFRVLKPGAFVAAFGASRGYHRMACAIEDAGFEIRDSLCWLYGSGFPKSQNVAKFIDKELGAAGSLGAPKSAAHAGWIDRGRMRGDGSENEEGWQRPWMADAESVDQAARQYLPASPAAQEFDGFGTALKPAFEPIVLARKPLSEPTVAANVLKWRTGALNIDGCRVHAEGSEAKAYTVKRLKPGATLAREGGNWRPDAEDAVEYQGMTKDGRWPANVVTDGSDEVVGMFPNSDSRGGKTKRATDIGFHGNGSGADTANYGNDSGSTARFFYSAKASRADRAGSKHPTVKPISLMQWLARLITPPGGTILDPFAGSGTTGAAARQEGFSVILCEREAEYVADIRRRLATPLAAARLVVPHDAPPLADLAALQARLVRA